MRANHYQLTACFIALLAGLTVSGQTVSIATEPCRMAEQRNNYFEIHPEAKQEEETNEQFTKAFVEQRTNNEQGSRASQYIIPCVFHVYGAKQGGKDVTLAVIEATMKDWANKDFAGKNDDYNTVHTKFLSLRDTLSISFVLAKKDPSGNPTTGIVFHPVQKGFGSATGYDDKIQADAWNNYQYMNFYIMNDLYGDGNLNNSGSTTPPITSISDMKLARVVYNGAFLGPNTIKEYASVMTHEIGHFFNLMHTFDQGCKSATNDNVDDTPPEDYDAKTPCHTSSTVNAPLNCNGDLLNVENYMDYVGPNGCYKMFTKGQVLRMKAALELPSRKPLWQKDNLIKTGVLPGTVGIMEERAAFSAVIYPNPGTGIFNLEVSTDKQDVFQINVVDMIGNIVFSTQTVPVASVLTKPIDLSSLSKGVYFVSLKGSSSQQSFKLIKQ